MRKVILGRSGLEVSAVGFGGIPIQRLSTEAAVATIRTALDLGLTFLDTAAGYSDSQKKIGEAIRGRRDGLVLASKSGDRTRDGIRRDIERACRELGTDRIDLYQLHGVSSRDAWNQVKAPQGALAGLREAREDGLIGHLGVTSHNLDLAMELAEEPAFETIQFPFNLVTAEPADSLIPKARRLGLGFIVMKPMCGGQFDDAALAFKFLNAFPDLVPIPGIERPEEIRQIVGIVESGETLAGEERTRADRIVTQLGKRFCRRCGYCEPCPNGVPIQQAMIFESLVKRFEPGKLKAGPAQHLAEEAPQCTECGECEPKCPYSLPIIETIKESLASARRIVKD
jgi:hypothetical protein